jgi:2-dehydro-3-deoxyphosphooctonate aldolase (KDO 8-P synthase)
LIRIGAIEMGAQTPLVLIAGPDIVESEAATLAAARKVKASAARYGLPAIFKCSYDKANRTSLGSYRGIGIEQGLAVLAKVKREVGLPLLTDVHDVSQVRAAAEVADVLQVPAFLCRQTDLIVACAKSGRAVNLKKGQFVAPRDMRHAVAKAKESGNENVFLTERGASFGYNNLVVDMRSLGILREYAPVCFDATHSVQLPSADGGTTGGERAFVAPLARAAAAAGIDALFLEVHENPDQAKCDGPNSLDFTALDRLLGEVTAIRRALAQP